MGIGQLIFVLSSPFFFKKKLFLGFLIYDDDLWVHQGREVKRGLPTHLLMSLWLLVRVIGVTFYSLSV